MDNITLAHAKEHLEELIERARLGEEVRISDAKGTAVRLVVAEELTAQPSRVVFGQWKHLGEIPMERLLEPLSEEQLAWLSGEHVSSE